MINKKRAESRSRYYIREQAEKRGWNLQHPNRKGDCLEEQEIAAHFQDIGLGLERPDFIFTRDGMPAVVIEAKNTADKINQAIAQAYIQPWGFMARGNGGSAVRVLIPKYKMDFNTLVWFTAQINAQRWRFFYGRMAIKSRLERLEITSPSVSLIKSNHAIAEKIKEFRDNLFKLSGA